MKACHDKFFRNLRFVWKSPWHPSGTATISEGDQDHKMKWVMGFEEIELELLGKNDTIAFGTAFSLALLLENSASLHYISKDTLLGNRTSGTIFFHRHLKAGTLCWWEGDKKKIKTAINQIDMKKNITITVDENCWKTQKDILTITNTSISHLVETHLIYLCNKKRSVEHISPLVRKPFGIITLPEDCNKKMTTLDG